MLLAGAFAGTHVWYIDFWLVCARDSFVGLRWRLACIFIIIDVWFSLPKGRFGYAFCMHSHSLRNKCLTKRRATETSVYDVFVVVVLVAIVKHIMFGLYG